MLYVYVFIITKNEPKKDLMLLIRQDVDRTIPEVAFFQSEKIRTMMCNILFIHAKIDPGLCYKQGMHEILGRCPAQFYFLVIK